MTTARVRGMVTDIPGQKRDKKNKNKKPGLWDCGMAIDVLVKNDFKKKNRKKPCPRDRGMVTAGPG